MLGEWVLMRPLSDAWEADRGLCLPLAITAAAIVAIGFSSAVGIVASVVEVEPGFAWQTIQEVRKSCPHF